jgi:hypothetical protein
MWLRLATSGSAFGGRQPYLFVRKIHYVILPLRLLQQLVHAGHPTAIGMVIARDKRPIDSLSQTA